MQDRLDQKYSIRRKEFKKEKELIKSTVVEDEIDSNRFSERYKELISIVDYVIEKKNVAREGE